jgi:hypothetical protein
MRIFCILISISFKLFASPIDKRKTTISHEFKGSIIDIASFEKGLNQTKALEHYSAHTIPDKSSFYFEYFFALLLKQRNTFSWVCTIPTSSFISCTSISVSDSSQILPILFIYLEQTNLFLP